jgi:hypothetical protein
MKNISIDPYSTSASQLEMRFGETLLSIGTCFFWEYDRNRFMVTNWHNLAGINPVTGKHLSPNGGEPDNVHFDIWAHQDLNQRGFAHLPIEDENGPLWLEHPIHRRAVDVVCLRLPDEISPHVFPINQQNQKPLLTRITDDVFILGFPMGLGPEKNYRFGREPASHLNQI